VSVPQTQLLLLRAFDSLTALNEALTLTAVGGKWKVEVKPPANPHTRSGSAQSPCMLANGYGVRCHAGVPLGASALKDGRQRLASKLPHPISPTSRILHTAHGLVAAWCAVARTQIPSSMAQARWAGGQ
jgi:hypothetical protein